MITENKHLYIYTDLSCVIERGNLVVNTEIAYFDHRKAASS